MNYHINENYSGMVSLGVRSLMRLTVHPSHRIVGKKYLKSFQNSSLRNFNQMVEQTRRPYKSLLEAFSILSLSLHSGVIIK